MPFWLILKILRNQPSAWLDCGHRKMILGDQLSGNQCGTGEHGSNGKIDAVRGDGEGYADCHQTDIIRGIKNVDQCCIGPECRIDEPEYQVQDNQGQ